MRAEAGSRKRISKAIFILLLFDSNTERERDRQRKGRSERRISTWLDFVDEADLIDVDVQSRDAHIHKEDPRDLEWKRIEFDVVKGIRIQGA